MAKLKMIKPMVSTLAPKLKAAARVGKARDDFRIANDPMRRLYRTARWRETRHEVFQRDLYTCQMCGKIEGNTSRLVCDHKRPHKGDEALFWDRLNLQTLCANPCHNSLKQREDRRYQGGGI